MRKIIEKKKILYFLFFVEFNSVFYRCTNCLADSVLYSCDDTQGFIVYCISTHWTIIRLRDCKEKSEPFLVLGPTEGWKQEKYFPWESANHGKTCTSGHATLNKMYKTKGNIHVKKIGTSTFDSCLNLVYFIPRRHSYYEIYWI